MTQIARIVLLIYGLALIAGGVLGYVNAGSKASLISGGVSGVAAMLASLISFRRPRLGLAIGFLVAAAVGYMMFRRYSAPGDTPKDVPFRVAIASLITVLVVLAALLVPRRRQGGA